MSDVLTILDRRITDALAALRYARAVVAHSANTTTRGHEESAERTLNGLLDQRHRVQEDAAALAGAPARARSGR